MTKIKLVRIYDNEQPLGYRILVDRLWPRGKSKKDANIDEWVKEIGPSTELRKWFNHDDTKYSEFRQKYLNELDHNPVTVNFIAQVKAELAKQDVLFLYGAKNKEHNQAVVLKEYVDQRL